MRSSPSGWLSWLWPGPSPSSESSTKPTLPSLTLKSSIPRHKRPSSLSTEKTSPKPKPTRTFKHSELETLISRLKSVTRD